MAVFPKEFVWGAATAAYQIEGGAVEDGKGRSIWDVFSHTPGCTYRGETGDTACDSYHRWREDIELLKSMHLKAYRFSVAWTRIAPTGGTDWNEKGFAYYDGLVNTLLEAGIEPYITLYHWDLPQALEEKGGWQNEDTARAFAVYTAKMAEHFKGRVHQWFTFNEPACIVKMGYGTGEHAPGLKLPLEGQFTCWQNIIYAHCLAAQELGLGAVWLGTWPQMDRVEAQQKLFDLPETIVPHSIIALGYPEADITVPRESRYEDDRVHFEQW